MMTFFKDQISTFVRWRIKETYICECRIDGNPQSGPGFKLQVVDLKRLCGLEIQLWYSHRHQAPQVFQSLHQTRIQLWRIFHAALQVVRKLVLLAIHLHRHQGGKSQDNRAELHDAWRLESVFLNVLLWSVSS